MKFSKFKYGGLLSLPLALAAMQAEAAYINGDSTGAFSNTGGTTDCNDVSRCRIYNNGKNLEWGYSTFLGYPISDTGSTLKAITQDWYFNTPENDAKIAQLNWKNRATSASITPDLFNVNYTLTIDFDWPTSASPFSETFSFSINNTNNSNNPSGDNLSILSLDDISNLTSMLNNKLNPYDIIVSDVKFVLEGSGWFANNFWYNPENGLSKLYITADFNTRSVPEPTTLALFTVGLLGLGFGMRRKQH